MNGPRLYRFGLITLTSLVVWSCATVHEMPVEPIQRALFIEQQIVSLVDSLQFAEAFQIIDREANRDVLTPMLIGRLRDAAGRALTDSLSQQPASGANEQYWETRVLRLSIAERVNLLDDYESQLTEAMTKWAFWHLDNGNDVVALNLASRIPRFSQLPNHEVQRFADAAQRMQDWAALRAFGEILSVAGRDINEIVEISARSGVDLFEMVGGTATVWVDRGIRVTGGVGIPDRVVGSAFFVDPRGYAITNYHVVASEVDPLYRGFSRLFVRLPDRPHERIPARVVGYDRVFDVALIKTEIDPVFTFPVSDIRSVRPGSRVYAIGSPGGLESTITSGIVSAVGRRFLQLGDVLQVDVPLNPGNSGGPLINDQGDLIGIVFAGIEQFDGVSFAVPSFWIRQFLPRLFRDGEIRHPWIGVSVNDTFQGPEVVYVVPGSPADTVGIQEGDILRSIDEWEARSLANAQSVLMDYRPGNLISIGWDRAGQPYRRLLALSERPFSPLDAILSQNPDPSLILPLFGMAIEEVGHRLFTRAYVITRVLAGSIADETGLSEQDPFELRRWRFDQESGIASMSIVVQKRRAGFLESGIQLNALIRNDRFL